jgi:hypothetical protein
MNIFVLSENPEIAASYHCDQHLHKMILESAQMLSTAIREWKPSLRSSVIYKSAYPNHPCTKWVCADIKNACWVMLLARELEDIRESLNCPRHASMDIIDACSNFILTDLYEPNNFVFAGPPTIAISTKLSITEKYQKYYRQKHQQWLLDKNAGMSYKGRPVPDFMSDLIN